MCPADPTQKSANQPGSLPVRGGVVVRALIFGWGDWPTWVSLLLHRARLLLCSPGL